MAPKSSKPEFVDLPAEDEKPANDPTPVEQASDVEVEPTDADTPAVADEGNGLPDIVNQAEADNAAEKTVGNAQPTTSDLADDIVAEALTSTENQDTIAVTSPDTEVDKSAALDSGSGPETQANQLDKDVDAGPAQPEGLNPVTTPEPGIVPAGSAQDRLEWVAAADDADVAHERADAVWQHEADTGFSEIGQEELGDALRGVMSNYVALEPLTDEDDDEQPLTEEELAAQAAQLKSLVDSRPDETPVERSRKWNKKLAKRFGSLELQDEDAEL